jgi:hypothetical protein
MAYFFNLKDLNAMITNSAAQVYKEKIAAVLI